MSHIEDILHSVFNIIAKEQHLQNYHMDITPISSDGANYSSKLYIATLADETKELYLFAKVAILGEKMRSQIKTSIFEREKHVYTVIRDIYEQIQDENNITGDDRLVMPKYYGFHAVLYEEIIVLENLAKCGFTSYDRFKSIDWEYASAAVTELAKIHALSFAYCKRSPDEFEKSLVRVFDWLDVDGLQAIFDKAENTAVNVTKEENRERLKRFFESLESDRFRSFYSSIRRNVWIHGDYRPSNLMHRKLNNGKLEIKAVDYQTLQCGSPVADLLYFILAGSDAEFRRQHCQRLVDYYYKQLSSALKRLHLEPDQEYSREDFDYELKEKLPHGLCVAALILPIVTVQVENAPVMTKESDLSDINVENTSELFSERFNGVVDDYIRWGII